MPIRDKIFVSYCHKDVRLFQEFKAMLAPAIQGGLVDVWDDRRIPVGAKWNEEIQKALASASVAVLLVSSAFLASGFIAQNELPPLLKAAQEEGVTIFWIYLSPCLFEHTEIATYQAAYDISRPLNRMPRPQREAVLSEICFNLVQIANRPIAPRALTPPGDDGVRELLERCYRRALFTRTHAQMNIDAMFDSIEECRGLVQRTIPKISDPNLQQTAIDLLAILGRIVDHREHDSGPLDLSKIDQLKLGALNAFQSLAAAKGVRYALPRPGSLGESVYFTQEEAVHPPSPADLA